MTDKSHNIHAEEFKLVFSDEFMDVIHSYANFWHIDSFYVMVQSCMETFYVEHVDNDMYNVRFVEFVWGVYDDRPYKNHDSMKIFRDTNPFIEQENYTGIVYFRK